MRFSREVENLDKVSWMVQGIKFYCNIWMESHPQLNLLFFRHRYSTQHKLQITLSILKAISYNTMHA